MIKDCTGSVMSSISNNNSLSVSSHSTVDHRVKTPGQEHAEPKNGRGALWCCHAVDNVSGPCPEPAVLRHYLMVMAL